MRTYAVVLALTLTACSWFKKEEAVIAAALNCAEGKLASESGALVPAILEIVMSGGTDWEAALKALGTAGEDVLTCALAAAQDQVKPAGDGGAPRFAAEAKRQLAAVRLAHALKNRKAVRK